jgi:hypothetical protein
MARCSPNRILVQRTSRGYRGIGRAEAAMLQAAFLGGLERDWLFRQTQYIAEELNKGEIALAQIFGLRIPLDDLNDEQLERLALPASAKAGFNPDEPRVLWVTLMAVNGL